MLSGEPEKKRRNKGGNRKEQKKGPPQGKRRCVRSCVCVFAVYLYHFSPLIPTPLLCCLTVRVPPVPPSPGAKKRNHFHSTLPTYVPLFR